MFPGSVGNGNCAYWIHRYRGPCNSDIQPTHEFQRISQGSPCSVLEMSGAGKKSSPPNPTQSRDELPKQDSGPEIGDFPPLIVWGGGGTLCIQHNSLLYQPPPCPSRPGLLHNTYYIYLNWGRHRLRIIGDLPCSWFCSLHLLHVLIITATPTIPIFTAKQNHLLQQASWKNSANDCHSTFHGYKTSTIYDTFP